ncbi:MAG: acetylxylan esterase [Victivallaceae bacterium]|nr:acetylxylan esterase [Victivallaceae bacterium]
MKKKIATLLFALAGGILPLQGAWLPVQNSQLQKPEAAAEAEKQNFALGQAHPDQSFTAVFSGRGGVFRNEMKFEKGKLIVFDILSYPESKTRKGWVSVAFQIADKQNHFYALQIGPKNVFVSRNLGKWAPIGGNVAKLQYPVKAGIGIDAQNRLIVTINGKKIYTGSVDPEFKPEFYQLVLNSQYASDMTKFTIGKLDRADAPVLAPQYKLETTTANPNGQFQAGEKVVFLAKVTNHGGIVPKAKIGYEIEENRGLIRKEIASADENGLLRVEITPDKPGNLRFKAYLVDANGQKLRNEKKRPLAEMRVGAVYDIGKIRQAGTEPSDFDAFWNECRKELAAVPLKSTLKELTGKNARKNFKVYDVRVDCAGGKSVSGLLTIPEQAKLKSLPVVVFYYSASVCGANIRTSYADKAISFEVNAHGIDNLREKAYYDQLRKGELKNYWHINRDDRNRFYFKGMYLRVLRALEFAKTLPQWNGKDLLVIGASQGGAQAIFAGAMDKDVSFVLADVPALCDHFGPLANRQPGWPALIQFGPGHSLDSRNAKIAECARYYDTASFAKRMKAPEVFLSTNLVDGTCPPTTVFAAYHELPQSIHKQIFTSPWRDHWPPDRTGELYMKKKFLHLQ